MSKHPVPFRLSADKAGLIVVDMQNDFIRVGAPMELASCRAVIPNAKRVIDVCRQARIPIVYLKFIAGPQETLIWTWSPKLVAAEKCCWKNHKRYYEDIGKEAEASDVIEELYPQPGDRIVEKYSYGGFYNTNLHTILQANHVEHTIIFGAATPFCIDDTVTGAFDRQYKVFLVADATGYFDEEFHKNSLRRIEMKYGRIVTTDEILVEIRGS
ncbi:MAG TPA: isochorismatase family cysteine hydrolase [Acidobacteriota bacterium]|nr:isochorismatase family cysteine hydrolase [Acidobacteriota bacterium]